MTVTIVYAGTSDGYLTSSHATSYSTCLAGSSLTADTSATTLRVGRSGDATTGQTTKTYNSNWSASWYGFGKRDTTRAYQGNDELGDGTGNQYGKIGFPYSTMQSDLSGSTISKVELRMSNEHFWFYSGGTARFGTHSNTTEPGGSSSTSGSFNRYSFDWAKGDTKWVTLGTAVGNEFRDGTTKGITTGRTNAGNQDDYGYWRGWDSGSSTRPQLRITFSASAAGNFEVWLAYLQFAYTKDAASTPVNMFVVMQVAGIQGAGEPRSLELQTSDWGTGLTTADWQTYTYFDPAAGHRVGYFHDAYKTVAGQTARIYLRDGWSLVDSSSNLRWILNSTTARDPNDPPVTDEFHDIRSADVTGTDADPALVIVSVPRHRLDRVAGAAVQLSTGAHAYVETSAEAPDDFNAVLKYHDGTSATTVSTISLTDSRRGAQVIALVRDDSDNLYVITRDNTVTTIGYFTMRNTLRVYPFLRGAGYTWTAQTVRTGLMPEYYGDLTGFAAAWHPVGTSGTIVVLANHASGGNDVGHDPGETSYVLLNCQYLLTGTGSLFRGTGDATAAMLPNPAPSGFDNLYNSTSSMLDVTRVSNDRGFVMSCLRDHVFGQNQAIGVGRYQLNSTGTALAGAARYTDTAEGFATKDAMAKLRILPVSADRAVKVTADARTGYGWVVQLLENLGTSSTFTSQGVVRVGAQSLVSLPTPAALAVTHAWDAIYSPLENRVWIYYIDSTNGQRLKRTHVDLSTMLAGGSEITVNASVGATGSTNLAVRLHRGATAGLQQLISIANKTAGGTQSTIYVTDLITIAPEQPTLTPHANFNAFFSTQFFWTFHHASPLAVQGAFELQISNASTGASAFDTGKVSSGTSNYTLAASAIPNGQSYLWRVRTWDGGDTIGPWSDYGSFSVSNTGIVNITAPAIDNDPSIITSSYTVTWTVTGSYDHYRVKLYRTDTETLVTDSGSLASTTAVSYPITAMISGIEYRVEVSTSAAGIAGNTATRLITANYAAPEVPIIVVTPVSDLGYILVSVINPDPLGDRPHPDAVEIYRRDLGDVGPFTLVGTIEPNGELHDYTAVHAVEYEYLAIAGVYPED